MKRRLALTALFIIYVALALWLAALLRVTQRPAAPAATPAQQQLAQQVTIYRDEVGVPHIHGQTDAATAFGLAYAHAEDDFATIQGSLVAARGELGRLMPGKLALGNDFMVQLLGVPAAAGQQFEELPADFRHYLDAYAEGLNYYAAQHPGEADGRFFPVRGVDIVAGFVHKLPIMMGAGRMLENLFGFRPDQLQTGSQMQRALNDDPDLPDWFRGKLAGSNAHAVHRKRSTDDVTRLNVNSHQPWEGPVAWYEAHMISDQGMNVLGSTFPGAPTILHGHNAHLGWAHTVNRPDLIDVYRLTVRPATGAAARTAFEYQLDNRWLPLEEAQAVLRLDLGVAEIKLHKVFYRSAHGPVLRNDAGFYALRIAGRDSLGKASLQWYQMGKANSLAEFKTAMAPRYVAMMNTVAADRDHIFYVYNGQIPQRSAAALVNWKGILPGDDSRLIWTDTLPFADLPQVADPSSGLVLNTNATPFLATDGPGNPRPQDFAAAIGIEHHLNNRAWRSFETFGRDAHISRDEFLQYKFDQNYSPNSDFVRTVVTPLLDHYAPQGHDEAKALELLRQWDLSMHADTVPGGLIRLLEEPWHNEWLYEPVTTVRRSPELLFRSAVRQLRRDFGRVDLSLGELQLLRRGDLELPLGGGADTLNALHTAQRGRYRIGTAGDSYILLVEFGKEGVQSWSRHQYGNVARRDSPHYADQAKAFVAQTLKPSHFTLAQVRAAAVRNYHPGEAPTVP